MTLEVKYRFLDIPNVPDEYRLDGWQTGVKQRKYCSLTFPKSFLKGRAMALIRRRLGMLPLAFGGEENNE